MTGDHPLDSTSVILVGERLATSPGALSSALRAGRRAPAPGWPGCRAAPATAARSRPAACPTCCPAAARSPTPQARVDVATAWGVETLPESPGRDADQIVAAVNAGELGGLVVGGVDPDDTADPAAFRAALDAASFVVALELRETDVTRAADVVFPVAAVGRQGRHLRDLGGPRRARSTRSSPTRRRCPTAGCWPGSPRSSGRPLGFRTVAEVRAQMEDLGPWDGDRAAHEPVLDGKPAKAAAKTLALATWKQLLDNGSMQDGDDNLRATARNAVARVSQAVLDAVRRHRDASPVTAASGPCRPRSPTCPTASSGCRPTTPATACSPTSRRPGSRVTVKGAAAHEPPRRSRRSPLEQFGHDPWWIILIKAVAIFVILVLLTLFNIWWERRVVARMQHRIGPNVHGPFGLLQSLADGVKLALKEDLIPKAADKVVFLLAPIIATVPAFVTFAVIPFGPEVDLVRPRDAAAAHRHAGGRAVRDGDRLGRHLRHRARRLVPAARRTPCSAACARARR